MCLILLQSLLQFTTIYSSWMPLLCIFFFLFSANWAICSSSEVIFNDSRRQRERNSASDTHNWSVAVNKLQIQDWRSWLDLNEDHDDEEQVANKAMSRESKWRISKSDSAEGEPLLHESRLWHCYPKHWGFFYHVFCDMKRRRPFA